MLAITRPLKVEEEKKSRRGKLGAGQSETVPGYHPTLLVLKRRKGHKLKDMGSPQETQTTESSFSSERDALFPAPWL